MVHTEAVGAIMIPHSLCATASFAFLGQKKSGPGRAKLFRTEISCHW